ncbi:MAG: TPM domain-containing protein [Flavobacteriaceae bacterium]|jgi:uncharacterized protein|nr:TPM domain-containing protein [Flavobacteriaceae bacterium]
MKFHDKIIIPCFFLFIGSLLFAQTEFKIPEPPSTIYPVNDYAEVLTGEQTEEINRKLFSYSDSTSTEIIVCTIKTLDGDDINYVGAKWGEKWKIGQKGKNNGILLLIAVDDRKLTIQTGRGTEDAMTDYNSSIIINQYMVPYLKENDFYGAIDSGTDQIISVLQGKFKGDPKEDGIDTSGLPVALFVFFIIFLFVLLGNNNKSNTYYDRNGKKRRYDDGFWGGFSGGSSGRSSSRSSGSSWGGSSGGSSRGFGGGGSFGGGGASGSW